VADVLRIERRIFYFPKDEISALGAHLHRTASGRYGHNTHRSQIPYSGTVGGQRQTVIFIPNVNLWAGHSGRGIMCDSSSRSCGAVREPAAHRLNQRAPLPEGFSWPTSELAALVTCGSPSLVKRWPLHGGRFIRWAWAEPSLTRSKDLRIHGTCQRPETPVEHRFDIMNKHNHGWRVEKTMMPSSTTGERSRPLAAAEPGLLRPRSEKT